MRHSGQDPTSIGPFVVHRKIGEGSMGVVYAGYDVGLDRKVAIKLVQKKLAGKPKVRERMLREAQALARLSSPFVVQVYQVGEHDDGIYLAMEFIEGEDLRDLFRRSDYSWRDLLRALCDAGRGLDAAHAAGLIHRDFKPDNVLLGEDGRARVLDFGLVINEGEDEFEEPGEGPLVGAAVDHVPLSSTMPASAVEVGAARSSTRRPRLRRVAGTPAYMSPEQHFGGAVGPHSDQFSFAITLYEALYGYRPFDGISWKEIREKVHRGDVPPPPADSDVPRRLFRIILRALDPAPEARWPSMAALVEALEHDPMRARLRVAGVVALIGAASVSSYALARSQLGADEACAGAAAQIESVWGDDRRQAVERAFMATELPYARAVWQRVELRLDDYAGAWGSGHRAACEQRADGTQSEHLSELRFVCLDRRKASLAGIVDAFANATPDIVENAVQASSSLPSVSRCGDVELLLGSVEVPEDPGLAAEVGAVREEIIRVSTDEIVGRYAEGRALADEVSARAEATRFGPLIAEAELARGSILLAASVPERAEVALRAAIESGIEHDLHAIAAESAAKWIFVVGEGLGEHTKALAAAPFARALVARSRDDGDLAALLHNNLGSVYDRHGDDATALAEYEASLRIFEERGDEGEILYGVTQYNIGAMFVDRRDYASAARHYAAAVECFEKALSDGHPMVAAPLVGLGEVALGRGDLADARENFERARELSVRTHGPDHPTLVYPLSGLGRAAAKLGDLGEAARYFRETIAVGEKLEVSVVEVAFALEGLADIAVADGEVGEARALYERAAATYRATSGEATPLQARALLQAAVLAAEDGAGGDARASYERLVALPDEPVSAEHCARGRFLLAYDLAKETGGEERACALVRAAIPRLRDPDAVGARELRDLVCVSDG